MDNSATGGGISNNKGWSFLPSLALDRAGNPTVAWQDSSPDRFQIYIRKWDPAGGGSWVEVGAGSASGGGISNSAKKAGNPALVCDSAGNPVVAWVDSGNSGAGEIYIKRWNGFEWTEIGKGSASGGGVSNNEGESVRPSLALDAAGFPVVSWHDNSIGAKKDIWQVYIKRWNGSSWVEVGAASATGGGISNNSGASSTMASLALDGSGSPVVAWQDSSTGNLEICAKRWDENAWVEAGLGSATGGGISNSKGNSKWPSLAVDPTGAPVVAWHDNSFGNDQIYIRRFDGKTWAEIGRGSASGGGISNAKGVSRFPSLRLDASGNPVVAWSDNSHGDNEIFVKRWNGKKWVEIGRHSASGYGVSNNLGDSSFPSLTLDPSGNPVIAWGDFSLNRSEIYLRRFVP